MQGRSNARTRSRQLPSPKELPPPPKASYEPVSAQKLGIARQVRLAREALRGVIGKEDPIGRLGGPSQLSLLVTLAQIDVAEDGNICQDDIEMAHRLIASTKDELLNAGVVAALILSIMFSLAYDEADKLVHLHDTPTWGVQEWSDMTSMVVNLTAVSGAFITIYMSSYMYSQLSFWMPTLEGELWYVAMSASATGWVAFMKNLTIHSSLLTLAFELAVTAGPWDLIAFAPLIALGLAAVFLQRTLRPRCKSYLQVALDEFATADPCGQIAA